MKRPYVHTNKSGVAVVNASSPRDALKKLKKQEERDECIGLSWQAKPEDFKPLSEEIGVVAYFYIG